MIIYKKEDTHTYYTKIHLFKRIVSRKVRTRTAMFLMTQENGGKAAAAAAGLEAPRPVPL